MTYIKTFEELTKVPGHCDRCGNPTRVTTGSWLNTEMICMECSENEKQEPEYLVARKREMEEVRKGNLNYGGLWSENESMSVVRLEIPYSSFGMNPKTGEYDINVQTSGKSKIIEYAYRKIVVFDINGIHCPFYLSTGSGGKKSVPSGKWYPFLGIGTDGWFNKTSEDLNTYFGSNLLKTVADKMNQTIGDIRTVNTVPKVRTAGPHIKFINQNLNPTENGMSFTKTRYEENKKTFLEKLKVK